MGKTIKCNGAAADRIHELYRASPMESVCAKCDRLSFDIDSRGRAVGKPNGTLRIAACNDIERAAQDVAHRIESQHQVFAGFGAVGI